MSSGIHFDSIRPVATLPSKIAFTGESQPLITSVVMCLVLSGKGTDRARFIDSDNDSQGHLRANPAASQCDVFPVFARWPLAGMLWGPSPSAAKACLTVPFFTLPCMPGLLKTPLLAQCLCLTFSAILVH